MPLRIIILSLLFGIVLFTGVVFAGEAVTEGNKSVTTTANGYMFRAMAKGIFGMRPGKEGVALFYLTPKKLRIDLGTGKASSILDLDCKHLIEINHDEKEYVSRPFEDMPFRWKSRKKDLEMIKDRIEEGVKAGKITQKQAAKEARRNGLHVNDDNTIEVKQIVTVEEMGNTSTIAGYKAKLVVVKENDLEVFRLWLTEEIKRPFNIVKFYTAMGYMSPNMVKALGKLKGFPVKLRMQVTVKKNTMKVYLELLEFLPARVYPVLFTVPGSYKLKKSGQSKWVCDYCGKELPEDNFKFSYLGVAYELCSKEHISKLKEELYAAEAGGYF